MVQPVELEKDKKKTWTAFKILINSRLSKNRCRDHSIPHKQEHHVRQNRRARKFFPLKHQHPLHNEKISSVRPTTIHCLTWNSVRPYSHDGQRHSLLRICRCYRPRPQQPSHFLALKWARKLSICLHWRHTCHGRKKQQIRFFQKVRLHEWRTVLPFNAVEWLFSLWSTSSNHIQALIDHCDAVPYSRSCQWRQKSYFQWTQSETKRLKSKSIWNLELWPHKGPRSFRPGLKWHLIFKNNRNR